LYFTWLYPVALNCMSQPLVIIQARTSSTRMPGKVLLPFDQEKSILQIQTEIVRESLPEHNVVVATTVKPADDSIEELCESLGIAAFRGPEEDVLERFILCAEAFEADLIMRVCSDNPFLSPEYLKQLQAQFPSESDYFSFKNASDVPAIKTHWGLFAEIVSLAALKKVRNLTDETLYHEHVTNYIYSHPKVFSVNLSDAPQEVYDRNDLRFTIDTPTDFETAQAIYREWDRNSLQSLVDLVDSRSDWKESMNFGIRQFSK
jgi:spore coat polysaccharide biosynthesis protein SpsF (cytidylyltransferase family)